MCKWALGGVRMGMEGGRVIRYAPWAMVQYTRESGDWYRIL